MIDLHSHILPGLDDGAQTMEQALAMARAAVDEGIRIVAATPHHLSGSYLNPARAIQAELAVFNERLRAENIPLTVICGQELRVNASFLEELFAGGALPLNGSRYLLIELPAAAIPANLEDIVHELQVAGYVPIIAHPERNLAIAEQPDQLARLVELGALSQLTTHSLCGRFGGKLQRLSLELCRRNLVHVLASDAHDAQRRSYLMGEAYSLVRRKLGDRAEAYYRGNAQAVVDNRAIEAAVDIAGRRKRFIWR